MTQGETMGSTRRCFIGASAAALAGAASLACQEAAE
jgi:hypothetical protein